MSHVFDANSIPILQPDEAKKQLSTQGSLGVIAVDVSHFRTIAIEYGSEAYQKVTQVFNKILLSLQGKPGSFRGSDLLVRSREKSNLYYILLGAARGSRKIPSPGTIEKLSERIYVQLFNGFWREIQKRPDQKTLPDCVQKVPDFTVGSAATLHNPCLDGNDLVDQVLGQALNASVAQSSRYKQRIKEMLHNIIATPGVLVPNFQAVFSLADLTEKHLSDVREQGSLIALKPLLYGFEALMRVDRNLYQGIFDTDGPVYLESDLLRPDTVFAVAGQAKLSLELDQACLARATELGQNLPGVLLLNVLPRNLYYLEQLGRVISSRPGLIFEVSESEAVNNLALMERVRARIEQMNIQIAADDFGKGYSGLEQLLRIKPHLIKLDRSLVDGIHEDPSKQAFVKGLVKAAKIAKILVLAEGVEKWEEALWMKKNGVDLIQGFLLHKPQSVSDIISNFQLSTVDVSAA